MFKTGVDSGYSAVHSDNNSADNSGMYFEAAVVRLDKDSVDNSAVCSVAAAAGFCRRV